MPVNWDKIDAKKYKSSKTREKESPPKHPVLNFVRGELSKRGINLPITPMPEFKRNDIKKTQRMMVDPVKELTGKSVSERVKESDLFKWRPEGFAPAMARNVAGDVVGFAGDVATSPMTYIGTKAWNDVMRAAAANPALRPIIERHLPNMMGGYLKDTAKEVLKTTDDTGRVALDSWLKNREALNSRGVAPDPLPKKAGNINLTKYDPEVQKGIIELVKKDPSIATHKPISMEATAKASAELDGTPVFSKIFDLPEGQLRAEVGKIRTGEDRAIRDILQKDLGSLPQAINEFIAKKKTSDVSRAAFEVGGALREFGRDLKTQQGIYDMIQERIRGIKADPILSDVAKKKLIDGLGGFQKQVLSKEFNPNIFDKAYLVWLNSILSDPRTHMVNMNSNFWFAMAKMPEKFLAAIADTGLVAANKLGVKSLFGVPLTGQRTTFFGEVPAMARGIFRKGKVPIASGTKFEELIPKKGFAKILPTNLLQIEDDIAKNLVGKMEKGALAYRKGVAMRKGAKGLTGLDTVRKEQLYRTFQNEAGKIAKTVKELRHKFPALKVVVPFVDTPANIFSASVERTPAGIAFFGKAKTQEELARRLGVWGASSLAALKIGSLVLNGKVTGEAPRKIDERDAFYRTGKQPNAVRLGDKWVPIERLEPFGGAFSLIANLVQNYKDSDKGIPADKAVEAVSSLASVMVNKTYTSGLNNLFKMITGSDSERSSLAKQFVSGLVTPGVLNYVSDVTDPNIRMTDTIAEKIMGRTPYLSNQVAPRLNAFGEKQPMNTPWIPIRISKANDSALEKELARLEYYPDVVGRKYRGISLTSEERNVLIEAEGKTAKQQLTKLIGMPEYQSLSDEKKKSAIEKVYRDIHEITRPIFIFNKVMKDIKRLRKKSRAERKAYFDNLIKQGIVKQGE